MSAETLIPLEPCATLFMLAADFGCGIAALKWLRRDSNARPSVSKTDALSS